MRPLRLPSATQRKFGYENENAGGVESSRQGRRPVRTPAGSPGSVIGETHIPKYQGNASWMLPIPATFVVGQDGKVKARFVDPDYRKRMAIEGMIAALRSAR